MKNTIKKNKEHKIIMQKEWKMANMTIKHSTIKFEKMDKKGMYVNLPSASASRIKID